MNIFKFKCLNPFHKFNQKNSDTTRTSDCSTNSDNQNQIVLNEMNKFMKNDIENINEKLEKIIHLEIKIDKNIHDSNLINENIFTEINELKNKLDILHEKVDKLSVYRPISEEVVIINNK